MSGYKAMFHTKLLTEHRVNHHATIPTYWLRQKHIEHNHNGNTKHPCSCRGAAKPPTHRMQGELCQSPPPPRANPAPSRAPPLRHMHPMGSGMAQPTLACVPALPFYAAALIVAHITGQTVTHQPHQSTGPLPGDTMLGLAQPPLREVEHPLACRQK